LNNPGGLGALTSGAVLAEFGQVKKLVVVVGCLGWLLIGAGSSAQAAGAGGVQTNADQTLLEEQRHFFRCLAYVYSPALWISYDNSPYFALKTEEQAVQVHTMIEQRAKYVAFTNRQTRHDLVAKVLVEGGIDETRQKKLLLPYSETNQNLTPTLGKRVVVVSSYQVLDLEAEGVLNSSTFKKDEALIRVADHIYLATRWGHVPEDSSGANVCLMETGGTRRYANDAGFQTVAVVVSVGLNKAERAVLTQAAATFQKVAQTLTVPLKLEGEPDKARQVFNDYLAMASDNNPHLQFLVGKCYLEGSGTPKNEKLGLDWVTKAANNGSGEARSYLDNLARKPDPAKPK
jgi:hypothetical protein